MLQRSRSKTNAYRIKYWVRAIKAW